MYLATLIALPAARPSLLAVGASGVQVTDIFLALRYVAVAVEWSRLAGAAGALLFHGFFAGAEEARHLWALLSLGTAAEFVRRTGEGLNRGTRLVSSERHRPSR
jgi:hypothetical protein